MDITRITYHARKHSNLFDANGGDYIGYCRIRHEGGSYVVNSLIRRGSRGDAKADAARIAKDIIVENFGNSERS